MRPSPLLLSTSAALLLATPVSAGLFGLGKRPSGEAMAPQRFDLDCILRHTVRRRHVHVRRHLRVDLEQKRWCEDLCEAVYGLDLAEDTVTLNAPTAPVGPTLDSRVIILNRKSGRLRDDHRITLDGDLVSSDLYYGDCRIMPYSGVDRRMF